MSIMKCPHCGREYSQEACTPLIPIHDTFRRASEDSMGCTIGTGGSHERFRCPGSGKQPRNAETDMRPLWRDEK